MVAHVYLITVLLLCISFCLLTDWNNAFNTPKYISERMVQILGSAFMEQEWI